MRRGLSEMKNRARMANRRRRGMTLMEIMVATAIVTLVSAAMMYLITMVLRQQHVSMIEYQVNTYANQLQDRISMILRASSRRQGTLLYDATDETNTFFNTVHFMKKVLADPPEPVQSISYNPDQNEITHDPDINESGDETVWEVRGRGSDEIKLERCLFRRGMKPGGIPDSSTLFVLLEVSDNGLARKSFRDTSDEDNWITVTRVFAVNLRRE